MAVCCGALRGIFLPTVLAVCALGFGVHASAAEEDVMPLHQHVSGEAEGPAAIHIHGDLLLFPALTGIHRNVSVPGPEQDDLIPEANVFYSTERDRLHFLAELLLSSDEQEMERLQLGWLVNPATTLWVGRFHSPLGFWNTEHHHGAFLQTTISRPGIVAFEDEGGVLPTHIAGLLAEGSLDRERGSINYAFGLGQGPELESELEPVDVLNSSNGGHLAASARLSYRPLDDNVGEFGGFAGYASIPVIGSTIDESNQTVVGGFYNVETDKLRLVGEFFYVSNRFRGNPALRRHASFSAGYVQAEYHAPARWTVFGRLEGTDGAKNDPYLNLIEEFLNARVVAGSRFELDKHQALKVELSRNERQNDARFNQISLQWSMVYP